MKSTYIFPVFFTASLIVMNIVDMILGPKAEFLNACSVLQRLIGQTPSAGTALVAQKSGSMGEFCVVIVANLVVGGFLFTIYRLVTRQ